MTFCFLRGPLRSVDSSEFDWRRRKTLPGPCTAFSRSSRSIHFGDVSEANGPFSSPEPLGLICNEPLVSRPRDQETTGSGIENANGRETPRQKQNAHACVAVLSCPKPDLDVAWSWRTVLVSLFILRVDFHCRVIFTCVYTQGNFNHLNKIEARYK